MITKAFVLSAGLGLRMRPLSEVLPKPLIPIFQKPLITFALDHLIAAGVESFIINAHHLAPVFQEFFSEGSYRGHPVQLIYEPQILGTGGGIKNVQRLLGSGPFFSYSGDLLTDLPLQPLVAEHSRAGNDVTIAVRERGLRSDVALEDGRVVDISNRYGREGRFDYAGIAIWSPAVFDRIPPGQSVSFIPILSEWIGQGGKIGGVSSNDAKWFNIGSRREYLAVHRTIQEEKWKPGYITAPDWPASVATGAQVDSTARLSGFYSIGAGCRVGAEATLEDTILWPGAQIASRSHLRNCIVRSERKAEGDLRDIDI